MSDEPVWNIMTRTRGGTVSLLKNLTEDQARGAMQRLRRPWDHGSPWAMDRHVAGERDRRRIERDLKEKGSADLGLRLYAGLYTCSDSDLEQIECWGPPGEKLDVWPKPEGWDELWAAELAKLDAEEPLPEPPQ